VDVAVGGGGVDFDGGGLAGFEVERAEGNPIAVDGRGLTLVYGNSSGAGGVADDESGVARTVLMREVAKRTS